MQSIDLINFAIHILQNIFFKKINSILSNGLALIGLVLITSGAFAQYTSGANAVSLGGDCYRLTSATIGHRGYVYRNASISLNDSFHIKLRVNLGSNNAGGDGIMFVLRDTLMSPFIGNSGNGLGFEGTGLDTNSLGIEIDTKEDAGKGDIVADHIGIFRDGTNNHSGGNSLAGPVQALAGNVNIEDGNDHTMQIKWSPSAQTLVVSIDCEERITYTGDIINTIFDGDPEVYWGVLGATSGAVNVQTVCFPDPLSAMLTALPDTAFVCEGDTAQLVAGNNIPVYLWTPPVGLSAVNIHNPKAYPVQTTQYFVRESSFCDTLYDTTVVALLAPNFDLTADIDNALCKDQCDGEIDLTVSNGTGGANGYDYTWNNGATTEDISMLCDSAYVVTVQDVNISSPNYLCYKVDTFYVSEPTQVLANIVNPTKTKCHGSPNCDASAIATGNEGTPPYTFFWSSTEANQQANALCKGLNYVTVTDANGCQANDTVDIDEPSPIVTTGYGDTTICINSIAAIASSSTGGTPPFSFVWREGSLAGPVISLSSSDAVTPVITTEYFVQSFDANGCAGDTSLVTVTVRPPLDVAFIAPDTICPYDTIDIVAVGIGGDSNYAFNWQNGSFSSTITVSPDETRWYQITVTDVCGTPFTSDSVKIQVGGYPDLRPHIEVEDDSICAGKSVYMIASSTGGFRGPQEYKFTWMHNGSRANIQFVQPMVTTSYTVSVEDLCLSKTDTEQVTIYVGEEIKPFLEFTPTMACKESDVVINISEYNPRHKYDWLIDTFNTQVNYKFDSLLYKFSETGCYDFGLDVTSEFGCKSDTFFECGVEILENPVASFRHFPANPSNVEPMIDFTNTSLATDQMYWVIDGEIIQDDSIFRYEFRERNEPYLVTLYTASEAGCYDSISKELTYFEETIIRYPNSFSPNSDGLNDKFFVYTEGTQLEDFNLEIYDRLGSQVFRSTRQTQGWDGRKPNGNLVPMGTYYMIMNYRDNEKIERVIHDEINIVLTGVPSGL